MVGLGDGLGDGLAVGGNDGENTTATPTVLTESSVVTSAAAAAAGPRRDKYGRTVVDCQCYSGAPKQSGKHSGSASVGVDVG